MKMCDRCPGAGGCLLNYNGKACQNWRAKNAPDVVYTNADRIRAMGDEELALYFTYETFMIASVLFAACDVKWEDQMELYIRAIDERLDWLQQPAEEG